jgi:hypothetical protein
VCERDRGRWKEAWREREGGKEKGDDTYLSRKSLQVGQLVKLGNRYAVKPGGGGQTSERKKFKQKKIKKNI